MAKSITELLNYRTKFEEITTDFNMSGHEGSDINTLDSLSDIENLEEFQNLNRSLNNSERSNPILPWPS